jgi:hypothetical protein
MSFQKIDNKLSLDQLIFHLLKQSLKYSLSDSETHSDSSYDDYKSYLHDSEPELKISKINSKIVYNYNTLVYSVCYSLFPEFRLLKSDDQLSYMRNLIYKMLKDYTEQNHDYKTILKSDYILDKTFDKNLNLLMILNHYFHNNIILINDTMIWNAVEQFDKHQNIIILYEHHKKYYPVSLDNLFVFEKIHPLYQKIVQFDTIKSCIEPDQTYDLPIKVSSKLKINELYDIAAKIDVSVVLDVYQKNGKLKSKTKEQLIHDINSKLQQLHNI